MPPEVHWPDTLRVRILREACEARTHTLLYDQTQVFPVWSYEALCNILVLNRVHYVALAPLVYHTIVLTRPSQVAKLARTLLARPVLGEMVSILVMDPFVEPIPLSLPWPRPFRDECEAFDLTTDVPKDSCADPTTSAGSILSSKWECDIVEVCAWYAGPAGAAGLDVREYERDHCGSSIGLSEWTLRWLDVHAMLQWLRSLAAHERDEELYRWQTEPYSVEALWDTLQAEAPQAAACIAAYEQGDAPVHDDPFTPKALHLRPVGTRSDPLDWADATDPVEALPPLDDDTLTALVWRVLQSFPPSTLPRWLCMLIAKALAQGRFAAMSTIQANTPRAPITRRPTPSALPFFVHDHFYDLAFYARSKCLSLLLPLDEHDAEEYNPPPDLFTRKQALAQSLYRCPFGVPLHTLHVPSRSPPTNPVLLPSLDDVLSQVKVLLTMTPELHTLHLPSMLNGALNDMEVCSRVLHTVCLGPALPRSRLPLPHFDSRTLLKNVRHMDVIMYMPSEDDARSPSDTYNLPRLESVRWVWTSLDQRFPMKPVLTEPDHVVKVMTRMLYPHTRAAQTEPLALQRRRGLRRLHVVLDATLYDLVVQALPPEIAQDPRLHLERVSS
ncbi:hypothetical protein MNAN1_002072 [Malassezia nana]|uniref:Uncharacterized protein n=1 Tax=Malassezia nana TaxID=180528 RepID=A0AAF0EQR1_9BASI|nr:hypothetical protein MNAN1_002072 [Malassezia nana]